MTGLHMLSISHTKVTVGRRGEMKRHWGGKGVDKGTGGRLAGHLSQGDKGKTKMALKLIHLKGAEGS